MLRNIFAREAAGFFEELQPLQKDCYNELKSYQHYVPKVPRGLTS